MENNINIPELVGENIRKIIQEKGLKTRHISERSDIDVETVRKYINGKIEMGISRVYRIAQALDVEVGDLFK